MKPSLLARLADRLILVPTTHEIETEGKSRLALPFDQGELEVWVHRVGTDTTDDADAFVLKFPGAGSRAERSTDHPAEQWPDLRTEIWAINFPGYGGSSGRASLQTMAAATDEVYTALHRRAAGRPIVATGSSLGCVSALYLAARRPVDGMILRNPPALREVILGRFGWWNLNLGARLIARQIPAELCCIQNAARASAPAVFVVSDKDKIVPPKYQQSIIDRYGGPKRVLVLPDAGHNTPMSDTDKSQYQKLLYWLHDRLTEA
jgi:pimeloyl-ACP methyl ester carboxylesterase